MDAPADFICPITMEIMVQPVVTRYGHSFERSALMDWIDRHQACPLTRQPLRLSDLIPHHYLVAEIQKWRTQHGITDGCTHVRYVKGREYMQELYEKYENQQTEAAPVPTSASPEVSPALVRAFLVLGTLRRKPTVPLTVPPRDERRRRISVLPRLR